MLLKSSIPSPLEIVTKYALTPEALKAIPMFRETIKSILNQQDPRLLCIIGPCSIHDLDSFLEYARKFKALQKSVEDKLFLVLRAYYEKPRSSLGWKGFVYDPDLNTSYDIEKGLLLTRYLLTSAANLNIPLASELLDPFTVPYFSDLLSWGCIGARTAYSQVHRQIASDQPFAIGIKNGLDGDIKLLSDSLQAIQAPHQFLSLCQEGLIQLRCSSGNKACHGILRGSHTGPNHDLQSLWQASVFLKQKDLPSRLMIDCSHGNSQKDPLKQMDVLQSMIDNIKEYKPLINGVMLESFLLDGKQNFSSTPQKGLSLTDACLGFEKTQAIIHSLYDAY